MVQYDAGLCTDASPDLQKEVGSKSTTTINMPAPSIPYFVCWILSIRTISSFWTCFANNRLLSTYS